MRPYKIWARVTIGAIVAATALAAVRQSGAHENHAPLPTKGVTIAGDTILLSDKAREAIGLTTTKIELGDIHRIVTANGRVELPWAAQAMITSLVSGRIERVLVRPGEPVAPGQELAWVVSTELESLQLALLQARSEVALAGKIVAQRTTLEEQGVIAGKSLDEVQATLAEKSAALEIARQKLAALGLDEAAIRQAEQSGSTLPHIAITSPIGGLITHADVRVGQLVRPTDHLVHVVDPASLWIVGEVLEADVRHLEEGQPVEAVFAGLRGETFAGEIDHLRLKMDRQTRTQGVVVRVSNSAGRLRPGMFGRAWISVQVADQAIVCPADAVLPSRTGDYLLVQRAPGKYENRRVKLGLTQKQSVEVLDGVFPGDQVVLVGNSLLAALMGNAHKARVDGDHHQSPSAGPQEGVIAIAHGAVELPTDRQAFAAAQVEGRVRRILVETGQPVLRGDVLAEVDSLQVRSMQLEFLQILTQLRLLEQLLQRLAGLQEQDVMPRRQVWEREIELQTLQLKAETLKRQLGFVGLATEAIDKLERADLTAPDWAAELVRTIPVRAPIDGRIAGFQIVPGQVVHRDEPLFEVHDLATVWVQAYVHERDADRVQLGQSAHVHFSAYPGWRAEGKLVRISPLLHDNQRVLPVWIEVDNPDHRLKDGMFAQITLWADPSTEKPSRGIAQLRPKPFGVREARAGLEER